MANKIQSFALRATESRLLKKLAKLNDMSQSAVVRMAIAKLAQSMGVSANGR